MAVVNFPDNPSDGDTQAVGGITYTYSSSKGYWTAAASSGGGGGGGASVTTDDAAPSSPSDGDLWYDTDDGGMFVYYEDADSSQWVEVIGSQGSPGADGAAGADGGAGVASVYATVNDLPTSGNSQGDMAHVTANNTLYFWNGSGWYKIALINTNPSISGVSSSYDLATDGTATTVTVTASDPEGLPITYSIASDTSGNIATVTQGTGANTNVFTITPSTSDANAGTFSLTFRASDGVNIATAPASFTLQFRVENSNYTTALITSVGANNAVNNSFVDSSTNNQTITAAGDITQTTFSPHRHGGYSTYFDGTGDYVTAPSDTSFDFGTGDFTIEMWINIPDVASAWLAFISRGYAINGGWRLYKNTGNSNLRFYYTDSGTNSYIEASSTGITNNTWHHIAIVRNSSTTTIYVDGVSKGSGTISTSLNPGSYAVEVGSGVVTSGYPITGYMTDVRIVKGTAVYTSAFASPTERLTAITNTSLLTCHLPYIAGDVAPVGYTGSGSIVGSSGSLDSGTLANAFDGSLSTSVAIRNSGSFIEFTFPQQQTGELQVNITNGNDVGDNNVQFWIDGVAGTSFDVSSQTWYSLTSSSDSFTTVKLEHSGSTTANIYGFRIGTSGDTITGLRPDITINGNTKTEAFAPYDYQEYLSSSHGGSLYNNGTGTNYVSVTSNDFQFGTSDDFVIEAWVYPTATPSGAAQVFDNRGAANGLNLALTSSNEFASYSEPLASQLTSTAKTLNQWYHVAVVRYNGTRRLFINGVSEASVADTGDYNSNSVVIASRHSQDQQAWAGNISDLRVIRGTIPSAYQGTSLTIPAAPLTAVTNTKLHLQSTNAGIIDKSQSSSQLVLEGNTKSSTTQTKYLSSSIYVDGNGDRVSVYETEGELTFGTGDFTTEGWIYNTVRNTGSTALFVNSYRNSNDYEGVMMGIYNNGSIYTLSSNVGNGSSWTSLTSGSIEIPLNTWTHVALSRQGSSLRTFVNGTLDQTTTYSGNVTNANNSMHFGGRIIGPTNQFMTGYMSDFRVTKGLARYTANFTPPATALQG